MLGEQIRPLLESVWLAPLQEIEDPIRDTPRLLDTLDERIPPAVREYGCPLNNLSQEMATQDEGFRQRITLIFAHWIDSFEAMLERGKHSGHLRDDVDSHAVARFLIATLEGCIGVFKLDHSMAQWAACRTEIAAYLSTVKPDH